MNILERDYFLHYELGDLREEEDYGLNIFILIRIIVVSNLN